MLKGRHEQVLGEEKMPIDTTKLKNIKEAKEAFAAAKQRCLNAEDDSLPKMDAEDYMENILWWLLENYETDADALLFIFINAEDDSPLFDALMEKMNSKNIRTHQMGKKNDH